MAEKKVILEMTSSEEAALAQVLHWASALIQAGNVPAFVKQHAAQIGNLNAALNAVR